MKPINVVVAGAGRMGKAVAAAIGEQDAFELIGTWSRSDDLDSLLSKADVVIDFSLPEGTVEVLGAVSRARVPLVCGVSGLSDLQMDMLEQTAAVVPLLHDRNMSLGVAVLERTVQEAARSLGDGFVVQIAETHHIHKKDVPSGTAIKLAEAIATARGEEGTGAVTFAVERSGEIPGDHEVAMQSPTEKLTFAHSVTTRQVFAEGALRAARWIVSQPVGRYCMQDVLRTTLD